MKIRWKIVGEILLGGILLFVAVAIALGGIMLPMYLVNEFGTWGFLGFLPMFFFLFVLFYRQRVKKLNGN